MKNPLIAAACGTLLIATSNPVAASEQAYVNLPGDVQATPLDAAEMEAIRGEKLPKWAVDAALKAVRNALGKQVARKLENLLTQTTTPSFTDYQKAFGTKVGAVLALLPPLLKPHIAQ